MSDVARMLLEIDGGNETFDVHGLGCFCDKIESQLRSHGATHIEFYLPMGSFIVAHCMLPLDRMDEVRYIAGVQNISVD
jgi:hypothetical protein